jgi:signal transduction histidine kinase
LWTLWALVAIPVFALQVALVHARAEERAADVLRAARAEAARVLAGGVAHDFNNLLAVILGNAELALERIASGRAPHATAPLVELGGAVDRAATLTRRLLEHVGSVPREICALDVREVVEGVVERARASGRGVTWSATRDVPAGRADRALLETAVALLVDNALEAGGDAPVSVSLRDLMAHHAVNGDGGTRAEPGRFLAIDVVDTGSGIPSDVRARVFEPFFSTKEVGRGLGLSAVAGITRALGGVVLLESRARGGTTASLWIPVASPAHALADGGARATAS